MTQQAASSGDHARIAPSRFQLQVCHEPDRVSDLARDVLQGLRGRSKALPPKHFYDEYGSQLFERICETPEYYPTRTEQAILDRHAGSIIECCMPRCIVELGSGSARKVSTLLRALERRSARCTYVPFDVSRSMLEQSGRELLGAFPWLSIRAIVGDYDKDLDALPRLGPTLFMFLGGTIGNFSPHESVRFLHNIRAHMGPADHLLLGTDLVKDTLTLNHAYNDSQGITADFNKNVLRVINRQLGGCFELNAFKHVAHFDPEQQQIEMYLESRCRQTVRIEQLDLQIEFEKGERILTEISRKFTPAGVARMLEEAGLAQSYWLESDDGYFGLSVSKPG